MRLRQLECFVRTCELGSISRAAEQLNIAQPALGVQIRNLEHEFGAELLTRTSRGVHPTLAGEALLDWARDTIARTRDVKLRLRSLAQTDIDRLRLGLSPSVTALLAGSIVEEVRRAIPELSLQLVEGLSHQLAQLIDTEQLDLALVSGPFDRNALAQTPLLRERLYLISAPGAEAGPVRLADALALPLALPGENDAIRGLVEAEAAELDLPVTATYEITSIAAIKDLAARGMAHGILPYGGIHREVLARELAARPIVEPALSRTLHLVRKAGRTPGPRERQVEEMLKTCLATLTRTRLPAEGFTLL